MQRTKVIGVATALLSATVAALILSGGASAASWHDYKGDMYAGHAYGLDVPARSESVEFLFDGVGAASIGVYAPDGARVGHYALGPALTSASIASPTAGRYVVYVYDVADGALGVRVNSADEPAQLSLQKVDLLREDTKLGTFEQGKLDQVITSDLKRAPVFVTLLYQGSSTDLEATVSSAKGAVVRIQDESATAFSPGVWTTLKGERAFDASQLDGTTYTVEVHAAQFEGSMVLTTLALDLRAPVAPDARIAAPPAPPAAPSKAPRAEAIAFDPEAAHFALREGVPLAFGSAATTLLLADPSAFSEDEHRGHYDVALVAIYAPDDSLLGVFELSQDEPVVSIELPTKGEYVAYAMHVEGDAILGQLVGAKPLALRTLETSTQTFTVNSTLLGERAEHAFALAQAPVDIAIRFSDGLGTLSSVSVENEKGTVAYASNIVAAPGIHFLQWNSVDAEMFAKGEHALMMHGGYEGTIEVITTTYVRASDAAEPVEEAVEEEPSGSWPIPLAPPVPLAAPAIGLPL